MTICYYLNVLLWCHSVHLYCKWEIWQYVNLFSVFGFVSFRLTKSTERKKKWALNQFEKWQIARNKLADIPGSPYGHIKPHLEDMTIEELNFTLCKFISEIKKNNGQDDYPGNTLYEIMMSLQLHLHVSGKKYKFLQDERFEMIKNTLDREMRDRAKDGIGNDVKRADVISLEEEEILWEKGILGFHDQYSLFNSMLYLLGINFALRGGEDHRHLSWDNPQLKICRDKDGVKVLRYREYTSKCNQGGLKDRKRKRKCVDAYPNPDQSRCVVRCFELYKSHVPKIKPNAFYLRPLQNCRGDVWYSSTPVGKHKLDEVVKNMCQKAGIGGFRTNHSLRATCATRMFEEDVDEQCICDVTGHTSLAVRQYKHTSVAKKRILSSIIQGRGKYSKSKRYRTRSSTLGKRFKPKVSSSTEDVDLSSSQNLSKFSPSSSSSQEDPPPSPVCSIQEDSPPSPVCSIQEDPLPSPVCSTVVSSTTTTESCSQDSSCAAKANDPVCPPQVGEESQDLDSNMPEDCSENLPSGNSWPIPGPDLYPYRSPFLYTYNPVGVPFWQCPPNVEENKLPSSENVPNHSSQQTGGNVSSCSGMGNPSFQYVPNVDNAMFCSNLQNLPSTGTNAPLVNQVLWPGCAAHTSGTSNVSSTSDARCMKLEFNFNFPPH